MALGISDHFNGTTFFQPGAHPERGFREVLKWKLTSRSARWPRHVPLVPHGPVPEPAGDELVITWLGHASFLLRTTAGNVLFDPVFSDRVSPFPWIGPRRVQPPPLTIDTLPSIDVVCVSHDHYDHCDVDTLHALATRFDPLFVAPLRHADLLRSAGAHRIAELDWWESHVARPGLRVTLTPAKHWSNRLGTPRNHRLWGGMMVEFSISDFRFSIAELGSCRAGGSTPRSASGADEQNPRLARHPVEGGSRAEIENQKSKIENPVRRLWFVGDTGYDARLGRDVAERCGAPDVVLMPIGAYEPRWFMAPMHMNPEEAVRLHRDVGARLSVAMHWGTFQLTDEARDEPVKALETARAAAGVSPAEFRVIDAGQSVVG
ncbi:MAG TPA: MBL fold metallo-hydrolase [Opitutaceae bacterium]|nr:MBL fold metallo-hydrolase [Opitutaceae bacterium]